MKNTNTVKQSLIYMAFVLIWLAACPKLDAQIIFSEDFEQGIPNSFKLVDADGLTPNANLDFIDDAWVALFEDEARTNVIAISTSWYSPPGQADDWLMTPMIDIPDVPGSYTLQWRARTPDANVRDGYQVLLSTDPDRTVESYTDVLLDIAEEENPWTIRTVDLAAYQGQSVSIAFRNNSNDKFILLLDDISIGTPSPVDLSITGVTPIYSEFTRVPLSQAPPFTFEAAATNFGSDTAQKVVMDAEVWTVGPDGFINELLFTTVVGDTLSSLAPGEAASFSGGGSFVPPQIALYAVLYFASSSQADGDSSNNFNFAVDSVYQGLFARDDAAERPVEDLIAFSLGTGNGGILGNTFPIATIDTLTSITATFVDPPVGQETKAVVYLMGNEEPTTLLYESEPYVFTEADNPNPDSENQPANQRDRAVISLPLNDAIVPPGNIFVGIIEDSLAVGIAGSTSIYTEGTSFLFANGPSPGQGAWIPGETAYGEGFNHTFSVRANFGGESLCNLNVEVVTTQDDGSGNGSAVANVSGGTEPYTYLWSSGQTTSAAVLLAAGTYTVTITDALGCSVIEEVNIITVSIEDDIAAGLNSFTLYPNPNKGQFKIDIELAERDDLHITLLDAQGRSVYANQEKATLRYEKNINVGRLASGLYILKVNTSKGTTYKRVLID